MKCRLSILLIIALVVPAHNQLRAADLRRDTVRESDPKLKVPPPPRVEFNPAFKPLWTSALRRPEADMQRLAAEAIAKAHSEGCPGMTDTRTDLMKVLAAPGAHPSVRFAAAHALIVLDTRSAGAELFEAAERHGSQLRQLIEPALAEWDFGPARKVWLERVRHPDVYRRELVLAIRCLGSVREEQGLEPLLAIVHNPARSADLRLEAARAAGAIRETGLEPESAKLAGEKAVPVLPRLCAIALLHRHGSAEAQGRLLQLARDDEPAVAGAALGRLLEIDPALVLPLAENALQSRDANVRQRGVDAYVALPAPDRVRSLSKILDDVHPGLRVNVCDAFFRMAKRPDLDAAVRDSAMQILHQEGWRGQEQATLLLGALDHKAAAPRFLELLEAPRPEVMVTAAWGLRKLAVPDLLPGILQFVQRQTEFRLKPTGTYPPKLDEQVSHLCELFGVLKYQPAEPLMRAHVKKNFAMGDLSRAAAIWTLGHLHAGMPDETLAKELMARITDVDPINPEIYLVQEMSAITIGRMKAVSQVPALKKWLETTGSGGLGSPSLMWAITELTGERFPEPTQPVIGRTGWFLEPLESPKSEAKP